MVTVLSLACYGLCMWCWRVLGSQGEGGARTVGVEVVLGATCRLTGPLRKKSCELWASKHTCDGVCLIWCLRCW
jgi:hypothetical protein